MRRGKWDESCIEGLELKRDRVNLLLDDEGANVSVSELLKG